MWVEHPRYRGYLVSDKGEVFSLKSGKLLRAHLNTNGYMRVRLFEHNKGRTMAVHKLVAFLFLGPPEGFAVNHIDGDKGNNTLNNLEYTTWRGNARHAWDMGLCTRTRLAVLARNHSQQNPWRKYPARVIDNCRMLLARGHPKERIARMLGISAAYVLKISKHQVWE